MSEETESNKRVVLKHLQEALSQRRPELWETIMDPAFEFHHPLIPPGRAGYTSVATLYWDACTELHFEVLHLVAEGNLVTAHYFESAKQAGPLFGMEATGNSYRKHGFALYRLENGRLREGWVQEDDLGFLQQLGLTAFAETAFMA